MPQGTNIHPPPLRRKNAALILETGDIYSGYLLGSSSNGEAGESLKALGEVVFNTSMSGYQEIITDPSYKNQIVCFTYPSIGNYGINEHDHESSQMYLSGVVMKDYCDSPSNFQSSMTLEDFLRKNKVPGVWGIDTRALVLNIREKGELRAGIFLQPVSPTSEPNHYETSWLNDCLEKVRSSKTMEGQNLTSGFRGAHIKHARQNTFPKNMGLSKIAVLDFGIKQSIMDCFDEYKIKAEIFPGDTPHTQWKDFNHQNYAGFFLSNGPGDPAECKDGIDNARYILSLKKPVFGICLGHQIISTALGAKTYKMKFGHHGANQPVKTTRQENISITSQNHGFAVDPDSLHEALEKIDLKKKSQLTIENNLNDGTIEGFCIQTEHYQVLSIQYHPEASPGPQEGRLNFQSFKEMLEK